MSAPVYSVDTSALIDGLERYYPEENFPALWSNVDELIEQQRFFISEEVMIELEAKDEPARIWAEARADRIVIPTDAEVIAATQRVLKDHELLIKQMKGRNRADPFVIGTALKIGGVVVTGEGSDGTPLRPKIPYVCQQMGVDSIRFLDLVKAEGWSF